jgi:hypothetical protein
MEEAGATVGKGEKRTRRTSEDELLVEEEETNKKRSENRSLLF